MTEKTNETRPRSTAKERELLERLVRNRQEFLTKVAKQRTAQLMADVEEQLATIFKPDDERWAKRVKHWREIAEELNEHIRRECEEDGTPADFAPQVSAVWVGRRETASKERRSELRRVAQTRLAAIEQHAIVAIERECLEARTAILSDGIVTEAGQQMLDNLPKVEDLMPVLDVATLQDQIPALPDLAKKYAGKSDYEVKYMLGRGGDDE